MKFLNVIVKVVTNKAVIKTVKEVAKPIATGALPVLGAVVANGLINWAKESEKNKEEEKTEETVTEDNGKTE